MSKDRKRKKTGKRDTELAEMKAHLKRVQRELREALDGQSATGEILRVIASSPKSTQPVFETIANSARTLFPDATVGIALQEEGQVHAAVIAGPDEASVEAWRQRFPAAVRRDTLHGYVLLEAEIIDVPDVAEAVDRFSAGAGNFLASGYRAVTMMPIVLGDEVVGVLSVLRRSPGPLTADQFAMLQTFTAQANIAVANTHRVNEMRQTNEVLGAVSRQLAKYIPPQLYQSIIGGEQRAAIETRRKKLTVFFSDIVDFTEITDRLEPEELTSLLNEYLTEMSKIAQSHDAYFDKFIGDAMMFYFGDPESKGVKQDAAACVRMAIAMQRRLAELQTRWRARGLIDQPFETRMGINTGYCTVGNFGSEDRMDYTIIGNEVNLAARLEAEADAGGIALAAETYSLVKDWLAVEERGAISVKGFAKPIRTYAVKDIHHDQTSQGHIIHREEDGFSLTINRDLLDEDARSGVARTLKSIAAELKR